MVTGSILALDECGFRRENCVEATVDFALAGANKGADLYVGGTTIARQAPELLDQARFGLNIANAVGSVGIDQASAQSARAKSTSGSVHYSSRNSEQIMRESVNQVSRQAMVRDAGRQRLEDVRTRMGG